MVVALPRRDPAPPMFYVTQYVGSGTGDDPYRPKGVDGLSEWSSIDLSPDGTKGDVLVSVPQPLSVAVGTDLISDDPPGLMPSLVKTKLGNRLGVTFSSSSFKDIVAELLTVHAREDGTRWHPLKPDSDGVSRCYLGGLLWQSIGGGATITESFNKADADTLGPDLTWTELAGDIDVVSNQARTSGTAQGIARADSDLSTTDHYVQAVVGASNQTNTSSVGVLCRKDSSATLTFYLSTAGFDTDLLEIQKWENGSPTSLANTAHTLSSGTTYLLKGECNGSTLKLFVDGVEELSVTDTAITAGVRTGFRGRKAGTGTVSWDSFEAGDLAAGDQTVTPDIIASGNTLYAPTITQAVTPEVISNTPTLYEPRIDQQVQIGVIANGNTVFAPTVAEEVATQTVEPGLITNAPVLFAPSINQSVEIGVITNSPTLFVPTVIATQLVAVGIIANGSTVFAPTLGFEGVQTVTVGLLSHGHEVYAPVLTMFWVREAGARPRRAGVTMPRKPRSRNRLYVPGRDDGN